MRYTFTTEIDGKLRGVVVQGTDNLEETRALLEQNKQYKGINDLKPVPKGRDGTQEVRAFVAGVKAQQAGAVDAEQLPETERPNEFVNAIPVPAASTPKAAREAKQAALTAAANATPAAPPAEQPK